MVNIRSTLFSGSKHCYWSFLSLLNIFEFLTPTTMTVSSFPSSFFCFEFLFELYLQVETLLYFADKRVYSYIINQLYFMAADVIDSSLLFRRRFQYKHFTKIHTAHFIMYAQPTMILFSDFPLVSFTYKYAILNSYVVGYDALRHRCLFVFRINYYHQIIDRSGWTRRWRIF